MAVDGYMYFYDYKKAFMASESQVDTSKNTETLWKAADFQWAAAAGKVKDPYIGLFEIEDFSFDIEQQLNIGSQATGAGAGKVTFNPFSITRKIDISSPGLFQMACSGTSFAEVCLGLRKSSGGDVTGQIFLVFRFKLVAVKTISWSYDDESPKETITFEYGGLQVWYTPQAADGSMGAAISGGWNRVLNTSDVGKTFIGTPK